jgi:hypothetical protein
VESPSTAVEAQVVVDLRLVSNASDIDTFVAQYGRYLRGDEIFLLTKAPPLPGTLVRFRLELASGETVVVGEGTVTRVHAGHPNLTPGMDVAFAARDEQSRATLERMRSMRMAPRSAAPATPAPRQPGVPPPPPPAAMRTTSTREPTSSAAAPPCEQPATVDDSVNVEPQVAAKLRCVVADSIAEYVAEWSVDEMAPDTNEPIEAPATFPSLWKRTAERLPFGALQDKRLVRASFAGVALVTCMVVWIARSPSARRASQSTAAAAVATPLAALPSAASHSTAPSKPQTAPSSVKASDSVVAVHSAPARATNDALVSADATASLEIKTRPSGAAVSVDGKSIGQSPIAMTIALGQHEVTVTRVRYAPVTSTVAAPGRLDVTLKRPGGTLVLESTPSAADVLIEGKKQGKTPLRLAMAAFKSYDVRIAFSGGRTWRQHVYLKGPTTAVRASLDDASLTRR